VALADRPNQSFPVRVRDVSAGGINLSTEVELAAGTRFNLLLGEDDMIPCQVRHSRRVSSTYIVGCQFEGDPTAAVKTAQNHIKEGSRPVA
jgi:hypothetical protein